MLRWKKGQAVGGNFVSVGGHQGGKTAKNGLGNAASGISATLNNTNLSHSHGVSGTQFKWNAVASGSALQAVDGANSGSNGANRATDANLGDHLHTLSSGTAAAQTITGDNETRPTNRGVKYIIKV